MILTFVLIQHYYIQKIYYVDVKQQQSQGIAKHLNSIFQFISHEKNSQINTTTIYIQQKMYSVASAI